MGKGHFQVDLLGDLFSGLGCSFVLGFGRGIGVGDDDRLQLENSLGTHNRHNARGSHGDENAKLGFFEKALLMLLEDFGKPADLPFRQDAAAGTTGNQLRGVITAYLTASSEASPY